MSPRRSVPGSGTMVQSPASTPCPCGRLARFDICGGALSLVLRDDRGCRVMDRGSDPRRRHPRPARPQHLPTRPERRFHGIGTRTVDPYRSPRLTIRTPRRFAPAGDRFAVEVVIGVTVKRVIGIPGVCRAHGGFFLFGPSHSPVPGLRCMIPCGATCAGVGFDAKRPRVIPDTSLKLPNAVAH